MSDGGYIINDEQYLGDKSAKEPISENIGWKTDITANPNIHPTAIIYPNVKLGKNVKIGAYSVIGGPPEHREYWDGEYKGVEIQDNVRISNLVTIDAGCTRDTMIMEGAIMLAHSHVGHDALIGENTTISCGVKVGGYSVIDRNCNIGLNACIHQWSVIPDGVMIGMGGIVTKKSQISAGMKYVGNPVREIGENIKK